MIKVLSKNLTFADLKAVLNHPIAIGGGTASICEIVHAMPVPELIKVSIQIAVGVVSLVKMIWPNSFKKKKKDVGN